jgi:hypothetical protein
MGDLNLDQQSIDNHHTGRKVDVSDYRAFAEFERRMI